MSAMPGQRSLRWHERGLLRFVRYMSQRESGFIATFDEEIIRQFGFAEALKAMTQMGKSWKKLANKFGEHHAHIIASYASLWNGCGYCVHGHMYAYNIEYYGKTGKLFPIDENDLIGHMSDKDNQIIDWICDQLAGDEHRDLRRQLRRLHDFRLMDKLPERKALETEDDYLLLACSLYSFVNECSIVVEAPAPAMGPIAKNLDLVARYDSARNAVRTTRPFA